jgi:acyl-CoA synthetase (AMP-forming)/AMP-acid ligase II
MASEVELVALEFPGISFVKAYPRENPITGEHVELKIQSKDDNLDKSLLIEFLKKKLQPHMTPKRIFIGSIEVNHRFKKT